MAETPTGEVGLAMENLRQLLAESTTFQTAVEAANKAAALAYIHKTACDGDQGTFILICGTENNRRANIGTEMYAGGGDLEVRMVKTIKEVNQENPKEAEIEFDNFYQGVRADAETKSGQPGYFAINSLSVIEGPYFESEAGKLLKGIVRLLVNWGLET